MKKGFNSIYDFAKKNFALTLGTCAALIIVVVVVVALAANGSGNGKWGRGVTSGVPMPSGLDASSVNVTKNHAAAYFEDVTGEEVSAYIELVEDKCDVVFESDRFPRTAELDDKIIVIHYNVTEKKLSVTVAAKGDNEAVSSGDKQ